MPAKVVYYPDRHQHQIYWGGRGRPDGPGHNHMTIQDKSPDAIHFMRENGRVVVSQPEGGREDQVDRCPHTCLAAKQALLALGEPQLTVVS